VETEPKIVAFLCNWCAYAGADLAGSSRLRYPPNVRVIRVMCSGRVDPAFVFQALEMGADGVLVGGCHPGTCHYVSGNFKAEKRMENTKKLLKMIGLTDRLRLEWVSASEGGKFASLIADFTEELRRIGPNPMKVQADPKVTVDKKQVVSEAIKKTNVQYCLECGKCSGSCPISKVNNSFSPRRIVEKSLLGLNEKVLSGTDLWSCLTCFLCSERCPSDVHFPEFVKACRSVASLEMKERLCAHRGIPMTLSKMMINPELKQNRMGWLPQGAEISKRGETLYLTGCIPYFDVFFEDYNLGFAKIPQSVVKILNKVGTKPVVLENEKCCGHDLLWTGDIENFVSLARLNLEDFKKSGAKRIVTSCPECYRTYKKDYPEFLDKFDFEVLHISELLSDLIEKGELKFDKELAAKVVYHDPCRLGRHMGVYEPPRKVITSIPGVELVEMPRNRENAVCCGVSAFMSCNKYSTKVRIDRLKEAKATGANLLVTTCPHCQIHWKCLTREKMTVNPQDVAIDMRDLSTLAAEAIK